MIVSYSKEFIRQSKKLEPSLRQKSKTQIRLFANDPWHPSLRNHALTGKHKEYRSIDITGDIRALYHSENDRVVFDKIGTHSQLYG